LITGPLNNTENTISINVGTYDLTSAIQAAKATVNNIIASTNTVLDTF
jgi:hypothetical protein